MPSTTHQPISTLRSTCRSLIDFSRNPHALLRACIISFSVCTLGWETQTPETTILKRIPAGRVQGWGVTGPGTGSSCPALCDAHLCWWSRLPALLPQRSYRAEERTGRKKAQDNLEKVWSKLLGLVSQLSQGIRLIIEPGWWQRAHWHVVPQLPASQGSCPCFLPYAKKGIHIQLFPVRALSREHSELVTGGERKCL